MKLEYIIENIDKSQSGDVDVGSIAEELGIHEYIPWDESGRLKSYFYAKWYCTDTYVGGRVYFLDDVPVALSWQSARKSTEVFRWLDKKSAYDYVDSLREKPELQNDDLDLSEEIGVGFKICYGSQLLTKEIIYKNELCKIVRTWRKHDEIDNWGNVEIIHNNKTKKVGMNEITIPFCINQSNQ
jgi:hypothetical protein